MNELQKTGIFAGSALVLVLIAILTTPKIPTAPEFTEAGQPFYPEFKDPQAVGAIEIAQLDEGGRVRRFSVVLQEGRWIIPSKWNHPADAKGRLAKTAAAMIDLKKEAIRSDNPQDHVEFAVVDPTDKETGLKGNGTRIVLKDRGGNVLCDYIVGGEVKGKAGFRFVRVPGNKRVFETKIEYPISSKFGDWVETDPLKTEASLFRKIDFTTYKFEMTPQPALKDREDNVLTKNDAGAWVLDAIKETEEINSDVVNEFVTAIDDFRIIDVRRKTPAMIKIFTGERGSVRQADIDDLQDKGFLATQDGIMGIDGDVQIRCTDGVVYRLWFGRVVPDADGGAESKESRYVLVQTSFDDGFFPEPPAPKDTKDDGSKKSDDEIKKEKEDYERKKQERATKMEAGIKREAELRKRFADWYYVTSGEHYKKIRKTRVDLVKPKAPKPDEKKPDEKKPDEKKPDEHKHD